MQRVAAELNLSETAFCVPRADGRHDLRWFTPTVEVDLCGHATLATAHVLGGTAAFHTRSGLLTCRGGDDGWIEMDFPALPATPVPIPDGLAEALGRAPVVGTHASRFDLLVELASAEAVRCVRPDHAALARLPYRGIIVTALGDTQGDDVVSRFFAPASGVAEDPVTGSAHCVLAPFWALRLGRTVLMGRQVSARGGIVRMRVEGDRVVLAGRAVTVWEGSLRVDPS
jgi:predicted PhzF superfamily epimerase YddE/YHI9